ncbi:alpha/beta hydrolase [Oxalicibacterium solurbis]|uniref:alpha/beta hydrolase n=1 Tax=Oxalicibacterium solurbis TaxID=69280 RepID=UPI00166E342B|nr:alpha/beta hydrolase [Oxalicibacterium solurbis]
MLRATRIASRAALVAVVAALAACALTPAERTATLLDEGGALGFSAVRYGSTPPLVGMLRMQKKPVASDELWVVIEGDGRAWLSMRQPSSDPTPLDAVGWRLAKELTVVPVLYLARPCQFLSADELQDCSVDDWTDARFAEKWVTRTNAAIDDAKRASGASHIVLAGYSGGGVMAALVAAWRDDVSTLLTVASPLDHAAWTRLHGVSPLAASLNPVLVRERLFRLPQVHLAGAEDKVVPLSLLQDFLRAYPANAPAELLILPGIDHRMRTAIDLAKVRTASLRGQSTDGRDSGRVLPDRSRPK